MPKKNQGCDYNFEIKKLKENGPGRTYLLYGPEDYLRNSFLNEIKKLCIPEGESGFNYHRFDGDSFDENTYRKAIDSMPFMGDRVLVEIHNPDLAAISVDDVPSYCTVVFLMKEIDGRLKVIKQIENVLCFCEAEQSSLIKWVKRRFEANGKRISDDAVKRLIFISGDLMNKLIPEIEKVSAFSKGEEVSLLDINTAANHIADADVFDMVNFIAEKKFDDAIGILSDLKQNKDNSGISILSSISYQYRRLYVAKCCSNASKVMDILDIKYDFIANKLVQSSRSFKMDSLKKAIRLCCEYEYAMKYSNADDFELIKSLIIELWKS